MSAERQILIQDVDELSKMRRPPIAARPLTLLDNGIERSLRGRRVANRHKFGPAEVLGTRLGTRGSAEQALVVVALRQVVQAILDGAVQVADRCEVLKLRDDLAEPTAGTARSRAPSSSGSARTVPSGRSRNMKCRSARSPNRSNVSDTVGG